MDPEAPDESPFLAGKTETIIEKSSPKFKDKVSVSPKDGTKLTFTVYQVDSDNVDEFIAMRIIGVAHIETADFLVSSIVRRPIQISGQVKVSWQRLILLPSSNPPP